MKIKRSLMTLLFTFLMISPFIDAKPSFCELSEGLTPLSGISSDYIFIQQSEKAVLKTDTENPGQYLLELKGNEKSIIYFSDKPDRIAGDLSLNAFIRNWEQNVAIQATLPNVVLSYIDFIPSSAEGVNVDVLEVFNPVYNSQSDLLIYQAKPLHEHEIMTGSFENVVLIYDGIPQIQI